MGDHTTSSSINRARFMLISLMLAFSFIATIVVSAQVEEAPAPVESAEVAPEAILVPLADFSSSTKSVNRLSATISDTLTYTLVVQNGTGDATTVSASDVLPSGITFVPGSVTLALPSSGVAQSTFISNTSGITWTGAISANTSITITFQASVNDDQAGNIISNQMSIGFFGGGSGGTVTKSANTSITSSGSMLYMPVIFRKLEPPVLSSSNPTSANSWTVSLTGSGTTFELQEASDSSFSSPTTYNLSSTSQAFTKSPSFNNSYFYRVRGVNATGFKSDWSNVIEVVGTYRDNFDDSSSGWQIRRSTFIEKVTSFYESGNLILSVQDKWDWGLTSPMRKAPKVPYSLEYRVFRVSDGNLISHGLSFSGDDNGQGCPPSVTDPNDWYSQANCFNHFYNLNFINRNLFTNTDFNMLYEQVDWLDWCPSCGGSQLKRRGFAGWSEHTVPNTGSDGWNIYRVEVRSDSIKVYSNGQLYYTHNDTRWVNDPYFGLFMSTDEYNNSTWRVDYIEAKPLD